MIRKRLLIVSQHFWPLTGELESLVSFFAQQLSEMHCEVVVWSAAIVKQWPEHFRMNDVQVERLSPPRGLTWPSPFRTALSAWEKAFGKRWQRAQKNGETWDGVIVFGQICQEWEVARTLIHQAVPALIRINSADSFLKQLEQDAAEIRSGASVGWVAPVPAMRQQLEQTGRTLLARLIPDGVPSLSNGNDNTSTNENEERSSRKSGARQRLARAHPLFQMTEESLLAVAAFPQPEGRIARKAAHPSAVMLVRAWSDWLEHSPASKLWIVGDNPYYHDLYARVCEAGLSQSVLFVGGFDDMTDVLIAADCYVVVEGKAVPGVLDLQALAWGIPILAHITSGLFSLAQDAAALFRFSSSTELRQGWQDVDSKKEVWEQSQLQKDHAKVEQVASQGIEQMAQQYLQLLDELAG